MDATSGSSAAAAPRADASSPSGCTISWTPTGASITGAVSRVPSTSTARSRSLVSRRWRGTRRQLRNASRLARIVSPEPAPPHTYPRGPASSASEAWRSSSSQPMGKAGVSPASPWR